LATDFFGGALPRDAAFLNIYKPGFFFSSTVPRTPGDATKYRTLYVILLYVRYIAEQSDQGLGMENNRPTGGQISVPGSPGGRSYTAGRASSAEANFRGRFLRARFKTDLFRVRGRFPVRPTGPPLTSNATVWTGGRFTC